MLVQCIHITMLLTGNATVSWQLQVYLVRPSCWEPAQTAARRPYQDAYCSFVADPLGSSHSQALQGCLRLKPEAAALLRAASEAGVITPGAPMLALEDQALVPALPDISADVSSTAGEVALGPDADSRPEGAQLAIERQKVSAGRMQLALLKG